MTDQTITPETTTTDVIAHKSGFTGKVIAENVSYEDFLQGFEGQRVEWIRGRVIEMPAVYISHGRIVSFLTSLFRVYLNLSNTSGDVLAETFIMRANPHLPARAPDVMVVFDKNMIEPLQVAGPADLVVEVVSRESYKRDYVEKFDEYEKGGVREYWVIDPIELTARFHQLTLDSATNQNAFERILPDDNGLYHSAVLQRFKLKADVFWRADLPRLNVVQLVQDMLNDAEQEAQNGD